MNQLPEILAACAFFGALFVCPLVWLLMKHQRMMAELLHRPAPDLQFRVEALERELRELRAAHNEMMIRNDDARDLGLRMRN